MKSQRKPKKSQICLNRNLALLKKKARIDKIIKYCKSHRTNYCLSLQLRERQFAIDTEKINVNKCGIDKLILKNS